MADISGTSGDDTLTGTPGNDVIVGLGGADTIVGSLGNDHIDGGPGQDLVRFDGLSSSYILSFGADTFHVASAGASTTLVNVETLQFGDRSLALNDYVIVSGTESADEIRAVDNRKKLIDAGDGDDQIIFGGQFNIVQAGAGDDSINYNIFGIVEGTSPSDQQVHGGAGVDRLNFSWASGRGTPSYTWDVVSSPDGSYSTANIYAVPQFFPIGFLPGVVAKVVFTGIEIFSGNLIDVRTLSSNLTLSGNTVYAGTGDDTISSESNAALIDAGPGNDTVTSGAGNDTITGGAGNDVLSSGGGNDLIVSDAGFDTINAGSGVDTVSFAGRSQGVTASLAGGNLTAPGVASGTGVERLVGSAFGDSLSGDFGPNVLDGGAGADTLTGGAGADTLIGGDGDDFLAAKDGSDVLDGGAGTDTLLLSGRPSDYSAAGLTAETFILRSRIASDTDRVANVERVSFDGGLTSISTAEFQAITFDPLRYLASYADLRSAGVTPQTARAHYDAYGRAEGRDPGLFDVWGYLASNKDLAQAFGQNKDAALNHYLTYGQFEGRPTAGFDPLVYLASFPDLIVGIGASADAGLAHFLSYGVNENRPDSGFDPYQYLASNLDLAALIGPDPSAASLHYIVVGFAEGRLTSGFDALSYGASNSDLARTYRSDAAALLKHYVTTGYLQNRPTDSFDAKLYGASNADLARFYGLDTIGLVKHYLDHGQYEARPLSSFDSVAYLLTHSDLRGANASQALDHYLALGADQGRSQSGAFGTEQVNHILAKLVGDSIETVGDKDWFSISVQSGGYQTVVLSKGTTSGALTQGVLSIFDATGKPVSGVVTESFSSLSLSFSGAQGEVFYVVVESAGGRGTYTVSHTNSSSAHGAIVEGQSAEGALESVAALGFAELTAPYVNVDLRPGDVTEPYRGGSEDIFA